MAWTLCSKQDVISIHPTTDSVLQDFWSDAVEAMIRRHVGNSYLGLAQPIMNELYDGNGDVLLLLYHPPVISVESLAIIGWPVEDQVYQYPLDQFRIIPNGIELLYSTFPVGHLNISVSYTSGSAPLEPIDPIVRLAAAAMIVAILNYRGRAGADSSIKWGNAKTEDGNPTPTLDIGLVDHLQKIMRRLLRRNSLRIK